MPLNTVERALSDLIEARDTGNVERVATDGHRRRGTRAPRARRHPGGLHRLQVADARPAAARRRPVRGGPEHEVVPPRARAGDHLPLRPALPVQRVLQVLQERRQPLVQVHPRRAPHPLRRGGQPRHRHHQHQRRRVRGDAVALRRRLAAGALPRRRGLDGPLHRAREGRDRGRGPRRPRHHPHPPRPLPRLQRHDAALAELGPGPPPGQGAGLPARRLGHRLAVLPVDLARPGVRLLPRRPPGEPRAADARRLRPLRAVHVPAVAARLHAQRDDQAQQGPAPARRRHRRAARRSCTSTSWLRPS